MYEFSDGIVYQFVQYQWNCEEYIRLEFPQCGFQISRNWWNKKNHQMHSIAKRRHHIINQSEDVGIRKYAHIVVFAPVWEMSWYQIDICTEIANRKHYALWISS